MGQQLLFKCEHRVVPIHSHVYRKLEREVSRTMDNRKLSLSINYPCSDGKNGSRLRLCFWVVDEVPEKNEWICERRYVSSSKCLLHVFCLILFAIPRLQFMLGLHFTPACVLLSVCSLHFTPGPQSAVRSPQSAFYTDRQTRDDFNQPRDLTFKPLL